jgi:hypothetical protein
VDGLAEALVEAVLGEALASGLGAAAGAVHASRTSRPAAGAHVPFGLGRTVPDQ